MLTLLRVDLRCELEKLSSLTRNAVGIAQRCPSEMRVQRRAVITLQSSGRRVFT